MNAYVMPHLQLILDAIAEAVVVHDADGSIVAFNARTPELLGLTAEQFAGRAAIDPLWRAERMDGTPLEQSDMPTNVARLTGRTVHDERFWLYVAEGPRRLIQGSAAPLRPGAPAPCAVVVTFRNVTEAWEVSQHAKQLDALATLVELSFDGIVIIDAQERIKLANPAFVRLIGAEGLTPVVGRDFTLAVAPAERAEFARSLHELLDSPTDEPTDARRHRFALSLLTDMGRMVPTELSMARMAWQGEPAVVGVVRDDTLRRQLEAEVRQLQKVEAIGAFALGIAHDFANMLQVIGGAARAFEREVGAEGSSLRGSAAHESLHHSIERGTEMTRHLLAFARREPRAAGPIDSCEELRAIAGMLRRLLPDRMVLELDLAEDAGLLMLHRTDLEQVLLNLVVNARNAMGDAGTILIRSEGLPNQQMEIKVIDDGPGIPPEPADESREGSGLGLSIVRRIVYASSGTFAMESGAHGTTCRVTLPTAPPAAGPAVGLRYVKRIEPEGTARG